MPQVVDYSAGMPGAFSLRSAGVIGAMRYIGFPNRRKCTSPGELDAFRAANISMGLVFEDEAGDWKTAEAGGYASGLLARRHAHAIGWPETRPIYMAIDQDLVTPGDFETMIRYLKGANKALGGPSGTGVYGEADVIDRARGAGVAEWFWQSTAWSKGKHTEAHLFQLRETVTVNGIDCDLNEVLQPDWGQYPLGVTAMLTDTDYAEITKRVIQGIKTEVLAGEWRFKGNRNPMDAILQAVDTGFTNEAKLDGLQVSLAAIYAAVGTIRDRPTVTVDAAAVAAELKAQGVQGVTQEGVETAVRNVLRTGTDG